MSQESPNPQINLSKIPGGAGLAGALFAFGGMLIFLIGIPRFRVFLVAAVIVGCGVALLLRFVRGETPGEPWILSETQATNNPSSASPRADNPSQDLRRNGQALVPA